MLVAGSTLLLNSMLLPHLDSAVSCAISLPVRDMILDKKLSVDRVAGRISEEYEEFLNVMFSDENAERLVLRIR